MAIFSNDSRRLKIVCMSARFEEYVQYVCESVCMYVCMYVCMLCICVVSMNVSVYVCDCVRIYECDCVCMYYVNMINGHKCMYVSI